MVNKQEIKNEIGELENGADQVREVLKSGSVEFEEYEKISQTTELIDTGQATKKDIGYNLYLRKDKKNNLYLEITKPNAYGKTYIRSTKDRPVEYIILKYASVGFKRNNNDMDQVDKTDINALCDYIIFKIKNL